MCPVVIVIDDLQWADTPTLLLTRHLVRRPGERALLLTTLRDPPDTRDPLLPTVLTDLRRDAGVSELVVEGLHPAETAELVTRVGDGQLSRADAERIHDETGGNRSSRPRWPGTCSPATTPTTCPPRLTRPLPAS